MSKNKMTPIEEAENWRILIKCVWRAFSLVATESSALPDMLAARQRALP